MKQFYAHSMITAFHFLCQTLRKFYILLTEGVKYENRNLKVHDVRVSKQILAIDAMYYILHYAYLLKPYPVQESIKRNLAYH